MVTSNPFEVEDGAYAVLRNSELQYSLWPRDIEVPDGWEVVHEGDRQACLAFIEQEWSDMRPLSLRTATAG